MSDGDQSGPTRDRYITVDGQEWIARDAGAGATGTGRYGLAPIEAVHFFRPGEARPRYEALVARGTWWQLFDAELAALLNKASPVPPAE